MPHTKGAVLVVEDDTDIREALVEALTDEGYATAEARDGFSALEYLGSNPLPAVILLDWNMAPMSGPALADELAKDASFARIPIVVLTADARAEEKARARGVAGYLAKPVSLDRLFEALSPFCE